MKMSPKQNKAQHIPYFHLLSLHPAPWFRMKTHSCAPAAGELLLRRHQRSSIRLFRGRIYIILLCPHAEYYFAQPEVRQNLSFVHIKALALLTRFSFPSTSRPTFYECCGEQSALSNKWKMCAPKTEVRWKLSAAGKPRDRRTGECHETRKLPAERQTQFWPPRITNWI